MTPPMMLLLEVERPLDLLGLPEEAPRAGVVVIVAEPVVVREIE